MNKRPQFREVNLSRHGQQSVPAHRADRLPSFVGCLADANAALDALQVAVVGTGSVGGRMALHLARLGIHSLYLVDPKTYKPESVLTHDIDPGLRGQPKVLATARRCKVVSPRTQVHALVGSVQGLPLDGFHGVNLVVMAPDNLLAEVETGQRCLHEGIPLVHAAVHGATLIAQIRFFGNTDGQGPCPGCGYGQQEWDQLSQQVQFSCEGARLGHSAHKITAQPTRSISSLCAMAADLAVNQILRFVLGLGKPVQDTVLDYCGYTNCGVTSRLARKADCRLDHTRFARAEAEPPLYLRSLSELGRVAGFSADNGPLTFAVEDSKWVESGSCGCPTPSAARRFVAEEAGEAGRCRECHAAIRISPFRTYQTVTAAMVGRSMDKPLTALGARRARFVLVRQGDRACLVRGSKTR